MNDEPAPTCEECGATYVIEDVYAAFRSDYAARVRFAFTGRRPPWLLRFCCEEHRYLAERRRIERHSATGAAKRAARRQAGRGGRSPDDDVE